LNSEWEIVAYEKDGMVHKRVPYGDCEREGCKIHSVKRLPDGEVFSVGDFVFVKAAGTRNGWGDVIKSFIINGDTMVAGFQTWHQPLKDISKSTPSKPPTASEWEIVEKKPYQRGNGAWDVYIHSVKRLSDGEVFSVGDEVETNNGRGRHKINGFKIIDGEMCVDLDTFTTRYEFISRIKKLPTPSQPQNKTLGESLGWAQNNKERITVTYFDRAHYDKTAYEFFCSKEIDLGKHKYAIKQAIKQVLNDDK